MLRILKDWKEALDKNMFVGVILVDLSKAFGCLPHDLITEKLKAYGVSDSHAGLWLAIFPIEPKGLKLGGWLAHGQK